MSVFVVFNKHMKGFFLLFFSLCLFWGCQGRGPKNAQKEGWTNQISGKVFATNGRVAVLEKKKSFWEFFFPSLAFATITGMDPVFRAEVELVNIDENGNQVGSTIAYSNTGTDVHGGFTIIIPQGVRLSSDLIVKVTQRQFAPIPGSSNPAVNNLSLRAIATDSYLEVSPVSEAVVRLILENIGKHREQKISQEQNYTLEEIRALRDFINNLDMDLKETSAINDALLSLVGISSPAYDTINDLLRGIEGIGEKDSGKIIDSEYYYLRFGSMNEASLMIFSGQRPYEVNFPGEESVKYKVLDNNILVLEGKNIFSLGMVKSDGNLLAFATNGKNDAIKNGLILGIKKTKINKTTLSGEYFFMVSERNDSLEKINRIKFNFSENGEVNSADLKGSYVLTEEGVLSMKVGDMEFQGMSDFSGDLIVFFQENQRFGLGIKLSNGTALNNFQEKEYGVIFFNKKEEPECLSTPYGRLLEKRGVFSFSLLPGKRCENSFPNDKNVKQEYGYIQEEQMFKAITGNKELITIFNSTGEIALLEEFDSSSEEINIGIAIRRQNQ